MYILIVEDEIQIAESLKKNLRDEGHNAMIAADGEAALKKLTEIEFDLILLDWRMPKANGLEVCKSLRKQGNQIPIILLTALGDISNKIEAFNAGADDYITKPFSFDEVLARINAVMRRSKLSKDLLEFENLTLDLSKRVVITRDNKFIHLTDKEFDLLRVLIQQKGEIVSKEQLCKVVWDLTFVPQTNICEATVKNLRKKLEESTGKKYIKTIYGEGYLLIAD
ncbi:MAG: response regulator transcription factor [Ignavibacterium sp.]|jgi:DNA-binding response OmpR family regulator|uniref:response regulator transcription factor n=1 Tax=Ignavibacterium sp. TaxID=2651167 RepID=UPI003298C690